MKTHFDLYHMENANVCVYIFGSAIHLVFTDGEGNKVSIIMNEKQYAEFISK